MNSPNVSSMCLPLAQHTKRRAGLRALVNQHFMVGWLKKGQREQSGLFPEFLDAVRQVEEQRECEVLAHIAEAGRANWRAEAWYLSRRYPERWGNGRRLSEKGSNQAVHWPIPLAEDAVALGKAMADALEHFPT
jgi:hypothetical protein